jgi:hypothetical protein
MVGDGGLGNSKRFREVADAGSSSWVCGDKLE